MVLVLQLGQERVPELEQDLVMVPDLVLVQVLEQVQGMAKVQVQE